MGCECETAVAGPHRHSRCKGSSCAGQSDNKPGPTPPPDSSTRGPSLYCCCCCCFCVLERRASGELGHLSTRGRLRIRLRAPAHPLWICRRLQTTGSIPSAEQRHLPESNLQQAHPAAVSSRHPPSWTATLQRLNPSIFTSPTLGRALIIPRLQPPPRDSTPHHRPIPPRPVSTLAPSSSSSRSSFPSSNSTATSFSSTTSSSRPVGAAAVCKASPLSPLCSRPRSRNPRRGRGRLPKCQTRTTPTQNRPPQAVMGIERPSHQISPNARL